MKYSVDGGVTWLEALNDVRLSYDLADNETLEIVATHEGLVTDVLGEGDNIIVSVSQMAEEIADYLKGDQAQPWEDDDYLPNV